MEQEFHSHPLVVRRVSICVLMLGLIVEASFFAGGYIPLKFQYAFSVRDYFFANLVIWLLLAVLTYWICDICVRVTSTDVVFTRRGREYLRLPLDQWSFSLSRWSERLLVLTERCGSIDFDASGMRGAPRGVKTHRLYLYGFHGWDSDRLLGAIHDAQRRKREGFAASAGDSVEGVNLAAPTMAGVGLKAMDAGWRYGSSLDDGDLGRGRGEASTAPEVDFGKSTFIVDKAGVMKWGKAKLLPKIATCAVLAVALAVGFFIARFDTLKGFNWAEMSMGMAAALIIPLLCSPLIFLGPMGMYLAIYVKLRSVPEKISFSGKHLMIDGKSFYVGKLAKVRLTPASYSVDAELVSMRALRKLVVQEKDGQTHSWCLGKASGDGEGFAPLGYRRFYESLLLFCRNEPGLYADMP